MATVPRDETTKGESAEYAGSGDLAGQSRLAPSVPLDGGVVCRWNEQPRREASAVTWLRTSSNPKLLHRGGTERSDHAEESATAGWSGSRSAGGSQPDTHLWPGDSYPFLRVQRGKRLEVTFGLLSYTPKPPAPFGQRARKI